MRNKTLRERDEKKTVLGRPLVVYDKRWKEYENILLK